MKKITVIALLLAAALGAQARNGSGKPAYKDASRPVEERVSDLLSRMTLEEKVMQLNQYTLGRNDNANNGDVFLADSGYVLSMAQQDFKHIKFHFTSEF